MRAADLGPTPGSTRRTMIRYSSAAGCISLFLSDQKGSFIPGGIGRPAVTLPIFSCTVDSTLRTASFTAAATWFFCFFLLLFFWLGLLVLCLLLFFLVFVL